MPDQQGQPVGVDKIRFVACVRRARRYPVPRGELAH